MVRDKILVPGVWDKKKNLVGGLLICQAWLRVPQVPGGSEAEAALVTFSRCGRAVKREGGQGKLSNRCPPPHIWQSLGMQNIDTAFINLSSFRFD